MVLEILIFILSVVVLATLSSSLVKTLVDIAKYLHWREFIIAFFIMAFAASLPNLFIDLNAVLQNLPELAFGDILGGNLIDLTLAMAIVILFSKKGGITTESKMIQGSAVFTFFIAILPIFLLWSGKVTRVDGIILILAFLVYSYWLFSKDSRYKKIYEETKKQDKKPKKGHIVFILNLAKILLLVGLLLVASQGVINTAQYFAKNLGISLSLVGILIVSLGNCFPETYFGIISARRGEGWLVLGNMMGSVVICTTLILGIIAIICPFEIKDMAPFLTARIFTIIAALFFLVVIKTDKFITKKEGLLLLFIYISFLITEILTKPNKIFLN